MKGFEITKEEADRLCEKMTEVMAILAYAQGRADSIELREMEERRARRREAAKQAYAKRKEKRLEREGK